jgi:hypothetical protein
MNRSIWGPPQTSRERFESGKSWRRNPGSPSRVLGEFWPSTHAGFGDGRFFDQDFHRTAHRIALAVEQLAAHDDRLRHSSLHSPEIRRRPSRIRA